MYSRFGAPLSLLRKLARDERGRVGLGLAAGLVVLATLGALAFSISVVLACHPTYSATADCYSWRARSDYVGGSDYRLILIENVVVNGTPYQPSWSNAPGGVIPYNSYTGSKAGLSADGVNDYLWVGTSSGWRIFDKNQNDLGPLDTGPGKWGGTVTQYEWNSYWHKWQGPIQVTVTAPTAPTSCPRIIIDKVTDPRHDPQSFAFTLTKSGFSRSFSLTDDATPYNSGIIAPGTYNASEMVPSGWQLTGATCSDGSPVNAISVGSYETVTCTFTNTKKGHIIVRKVTVGGDGSFTFDPSYGPDFSLSNGQQNDSGPLASGTYSVAETGIPADWVLTSAVCDDGSAPGAIGLQAGEVVTCTFTNTKKGHIIVRKVTVGGNGSFTFDPSYGPDFSLSNGQQNDSGPLASGTYSVSETGIPADWDLTSAVCDDGSAPNSISLAAGEVVTCTFTNTKKGHIIVRKVTVGGDGSFTFDPSYGPNFSLSNGQQNDSGPLASGTYSVAETGIPADWVLTSATCDDGSAPGSIGLAAGETVTCTFTNTKPPKLIVIKHVINDDGGTAVASDFTITVAANNPSPASFAGVESPGITVSLDAGFYSVTEIGGPAGYATVYSADCIGSVAPGETKTCTVTNDDVGPKLIVIKHVINDDGGTAVAADFTMNVTANNPSPASFAGVEAPGTTVSLNVGAYSVDESGPSGYSASFSVDCTGSVTLAEIKTCTVTNDDVPRGTIIVEKQTIPGGAAGSFTFSGDAAGSISDNGQIVVTDLLPGTYTSTEINLPSGFSLVSIVCDDGQSANPSSGSVASKTATFRLDDDEVVKCTFTNQLESTPTPTPTPSPSPSPSPTPTPTGTPTETPSPTPPSAPTLTPTPTVPPIVAPETLTPKPTATRPPETPIVGPSFLPPSGAGAISHWTGWPWIGVVIAGGLVLLLSAGVIWSAKERSEQ